MGTGRLGIAGAGCICAEQRGDARESGSFAADSAHVGSESGSFSYAQHHGRAKDPAG